MINGRCFKSMLEVLSMVDFDYRREVMQIKNRKQANKLLHSIQMPTFLVKNNIMDIRLENPNMKFRMKTPVDSDNFQAGILLKDLTSLNLTGSLKLENGENYLIVNPGNLDKYIRKHEPEKYYSDIGLGSKSIWLELKKFRKSLRDLSNSTQVKIGSKNGNLVLRGKSHNIDAEVKTECGGSLLDVRPLTFDLIKIQRFVFNMRAKGTARITILNKWLEISLDYDDSFAKLTMKNEKEKYHLKQGSQISYR